MEDRRKGIMLVLIATTFWGLMGINSRILSNSGLSAMDIAFIRCSVAGVLFFIYMLIRKPEDLKSGIGAVVAGAVYGIICFVLGFMTYNVSVARVPISVATVLMFTNPIWVSIFGAVIFKDKMTKKKVAVIIMCILGCVCISDVISTGGNNLDVIGVAAGLINGITFAMQIVIPRFFEGKYSKDSILVYGFISSTIVLSFFADFSNIASAFTGVYSVRVIINAFAIAVLSTFIASTFYVKSTEYIETQVTSILVSLEPILGSVFAFIIFGETMSEIQLLGAFIVISAACILETDLDKVREKIGILRYKRNRY
ncbi:EamA family transporter [Peptacetobacter hominis]|uniref:EamA family transporter n=1 Tax=Peptacetobacter hominis TaxID=2743610 RepID=A0A544QUU2_9FIRM|nr:EamA family transporter [Peptacetobacter hominis]TQQ84447.1 EamA family transporter [Peptacetobacter hominis]